MTHIITEIQPRRKKHINTLTENYREQERAIDEKLRALVARKKAEPQNREITCSCSLDISASYSIRKPNLRKLTY